MKKINFDPFSEETRNKILSDMDYEETIEIFMPLGLPARQRGRLIKKWRACIEENHNNEMIVYKQDGKWLITKIKMMEF